jgi:acetamidase/formamidase
VLHRLPLGQGTLHGYFSRDLEPVLTIAPGDSVRFAVPNSSWYVDPENKFIPGNPTLDVGHALVGPIAVRNARVGQTLVVRIDEVKPASWGVTYTKPPHLIRWQLSDGVGRGAGQTVRLAPFLGVLGMPPAEPGMHSTTPPRPSGGNIDCKELVAGSVLFLPIAVADALFSAGDGHAAQGDGEISGTAIECPVEAQVTLDVRIDFPVQWPVARTAASWITFGFHEDLGQAARIAIEGMLDLMQREHGLTRSDALALGSVVVDLRVTQIANKTLGVHAMLRDGALG